MHRRTSLSEEFQLKQLVKMNQIDEISPAAIFERRNRSANIVQQNKVKRNKEDVKRLQRIQNARTNEELDDFQRGLEKAYTKIKTHKAEAFKKYKTDNYVDYNRYSTYSSDEEQVMSEEDVDAVKEDLLKWA